MPRKRTASNSANETSSKRQRIESPETNREHPITFTDLPLEILTHIILFLPTPRDLVSLSRTNSFLRHTLVKDQAAYIWRCLRRSFNIQPLSISDAVHAYFPQVLEFPDPESMQMKEWEMMFILFSEGVCEMCGTRVERGATSYTLKARLCTKSGCRDRFYSEKCIDVPDRFSSLRWHPGDISAEPSARHTAMEKVSRTIVPVLEANSTLRHCIPFLDTFGFNYVCRRSELEPAIQEYIAAHSSDQADAEAYTSEYERHRIKQSDRRTHSEAFIKWGSSFDNAAERISQHNMNFAKQVATSEGWDVWDLLSTLTFSSFKRHSNKSMQPIHTTEFARIEPQIKQDLRQMYLSRQRRQSETLRAARRKEIAEEYQKMASEKRIMPPLHTFRLLPVIYLVQNMPASSNAQSVGQLLSSSTLSQMLADQLEEWHQQARDGLVEVLGFNALDWAKDARKKADASSKQHPVDRITTYFECRRCSKYSTSYKRKGCLDFAGACRHVCFSGDEKKPKPWEVKQFIPCMRAIRAMEEVLTLLNCTAESANMATLSSCKSHFLCGLCEGNIAIPLKHIVSHSLRHGEEPLRLKLVGEAESKSITNSRSFLRDSVVQRLLYSPSECKGRIEKEVYGCRHCTQLRGDDMVTDLKDTMHFGQFTASAKASQTSGQARKKKQHKDKDRMFNYNALRSHLKAKHGIDPPGVEDFFAIS